MKDTNRDHAFRIQQLMETVVELQAELTSVREAVGKLGVEMRTILMRLSTGGRRRWDRASSQNQVDFATTVEA